MNQRPATKIVNYKSQHKGNNIDTSATTNLDVRQSTKESVKKRKPNDSFLSGPTIMMTHISPSKMTLVQRAKIQTSLNLNSEGSQL
jgi:hypothetical protein